MGTPVVRDERKRIKETENKDAANNIPLLAEYFAKGCDCLDGKSKITLAEKGLARAKKNEAVFFLQAMNKYNLKVQKKELASKEKMIEIMNEGFLHPNAYRYLVHSFNKQYADDYKNVLFELEEEVPEDVFEEFCCQLVLNTERNLYINLRYLRYVIEYQIPDYADADDKIVGRILKHIENHDILNRCKNMAGINEVKLFVKEKDFDMYSRLVHF